MNKKRIVGGLILTALMVLGFAVPAFAAAPDNAYGLVFIDDDGDGVWDAGEAGYAGAKVTLISPAYDEYELESSGSRDLEDHETVACSQQDNVVNDELNENQIRPCNGTWGLPGTSNDIRWEVTLTVPDGYTATSDTTQYFTTGTDNAPIEFGITMDS